MRDIGFTHRLSGHFLDVLWKQEFVLCATLKVRIQVNLWALFEGENPHMPQPPLTIGRLANAAAVNVETVRYYQRLGLITEPPKPAAGFRIYPAEAIDRIRFIKRAQKLGFSLQDIAHLLALGESHCDDVRAQAEAKLQQIDTQIRDLQAMRSTLKKLVSQCSAGNPNGPCPIVQSLTRESPDR